ncbi:hypothetical protein [Halapricum hydrolyticum]|uniref:Uncharacterized protein n=1 Tax=Halapricum hydrolyticum TaxID=2979991 RepID=A0AAE3ICM0_9EURY|nr:hypothetical protein [Halapricum hydrolyticum]MCU4718982.1 hypothetical protein [Halapricum hydrolyticum]MCU4727911.1 hypothetical protein [Halapricum hydrolyticum]
MVDDSEIPQVPGRSFLTKSQREYLFGKEFDDDRERQLRFQIRKNIQSALMDFQLIWNLSEKDRLLATKPLSSYYQFEGVADWLSEKDQDLLKDLSDVNLSEGDEHIGGLMHEGIVDLLILYATSYGIGTFENLIQRALDEAAFKTALEMDRDIGAFDVQIQRTESVTDALPEED